MSNRHASKPLWSFVHRAATALLVPAFAAATVGCASHGRAGWLSADNNSGGSDSGNSGNSDSGNSGKSDSGDSKSNNSSESDASQSQSNGSSNSHSETSGTVTTKGDNAANEAANVATLVLTGLTLIGLAAAGVTTLLDSAAQQAYLDRHAREVRLALARGQGTFVLDVGHNLGIGTGEVSHLGDVLREARPKLEPLLKDAKGFAAELVRTLLADPALAPRTQALMQMIEQKS